MFDFVKGYVLMGVAMELPPLDKLLLWVCRTLFANLEETHRGFAKNRLSKRLELKDPRPDLYKSLRAEF